MAFVHTLPVRFDDVDFARVVYYPKLFGYTHQTFEEFFAREVGTPYAQVLIDRKVGFPTVHAEADFRAPLRFGDLCRVELSCEKVGQRSMTCRYQLFKEGADGLCAELRIVTAAIDMDSFESVEVPVDLREAFARHALPSR